MGNMALVAVPLGKARLLGSNVEQRIHEAGYQAEMSFTKSLGS